FAIIGAGLWRFGAANEQRESQRQAQPNVVAQFILQPLPPQTWPEVPARADVLQQQSGESHPSAHQTGLGKWIERRQKVRDQDRDALLSTVHQRRRQRPPATSAKLYRACRCHGWDQPEWEDG